jgi:phosphoribosylpyrophosphate synthetase
MKMIKLIADNRDYKITWLEFSDGALTCKIEKLPYEVEKLWLTVSPKTPCKQILEELHLVKSALLAMDNVVIYNLCLNLPYLPYGRAERVFEDGNPNALQAFIHELITDFDFVKILVVDAHNPDITEEMFIQEHPENIGGIFENQPQDSAFFQCLPNGLMQTNTWDAVISPDKGAIKKASAIAYALRLPVIRADKMRDLHTGRITKTLLPEFDATIKHVIITDDLLDGGGTFIPLCLELKSRGVRVDLYVTHLIAAKGLDIFKGLIDNIFYYHVVGTHINDKHVLDFNNGE